MLTHIVIWKYRADIEQEVREEHVGLLRALVGAIPELVSLSVGFEARAIMKDGDQSRIIRARQAQQVESHRQAHERGDGASQGTEKTHVRLANFLFNIRAILPDNDVCQHKSRMKAKDKARMKAEG